MYGQNGETIASTGLVEFTADASEKLKQKKH